MTELKTEKKRFVRNVSWLFVAKSIPSAANFLEVIILARVLGLEVFGLFTLVAAYVGIVNRFLDFRVWESVVKYVGEFLEKKESNYVLSMIKFSYLIDASTGLLAFFVSVALAGFANEVFIKSPDSFEMVLILSFSLLFATTNTTSEALFRVFDKFKTITFVQSSESVFKLVLVLAALYLGYGIKGVFFVYAVISLFGFVLRQILVDKMLRERKLGGWLSSRVGLLSHKMKGIAWFLLNTSLVATLNIAGEGKISLLILGYFFDSSAPGLYRVARSIIKVIGRIIDPIYEVIFPRLVSLSSAKLYDKFVEVAKYATRSLFKLIIPVSVAILLFAEQFIGLAFGSQYIPASDTMRILTVAALFSGATLCLTPSLLAFGRPGLRTAISVFKTLTYVVLLLILVPEYSYLGAGIAHLIAVLFHFLLGGYVMYRLHRGRERVQKIGS